MGQQQPTLKYENRVWFWDARPNPFQKGQPLWTPYDDVISTMIEIQFQKFCKYTKKVETLVINDLYEVNVKSCMQINMQDRNCQRPIKRGQPNQRGNRPSSWRFSDNSILKGTFEPITKGKDMKLWGTGCQWLGVEYCNKFGENSITKEIVLQGIIEEQKLWNTPSKLEDQKFLQHRQKLVKNQQEAWTAIFNFHRVTDKSIKEIISAYKHSKKSDKARAAILKIYTYETDLYRQLNNANCTHDKSKIKTLGPFAYLFYKSLNCPPTKNQKDTSKLCTGEITKFGCQYKTMRLFRGLGLPKTAIYVYKEMAKTGKKFQFNGFTSSSVDEQIAKGFALEGAKTDDNVPCLLDMIVMDHGENKAYLNTSEYSAFPKEKEVLLGDLEWKVEAVLVENGFTVIKLNGV